MTERHTFLEAGLNPDHVGSSFDDWLAEEGFAPEVRAEEGFAPEVRAEKGFAPEVRAEKGFAPEVRKAAVKELLSEQLKKAMTAQKLNKTAFAAAMRTSRSQLERVLDPADDGVTLATLKRAAGAVGMTLRLELVPPPSFPQD